jgi:hypothetical protein
MKLFCYVIGPFVLIYGLLIYSLIPIDFEAIVLDKWDDCPANSTCSLDLATAMPMDWDTMYYFTNACAYEEIVAELGLILEEYNDIGNRVVFLHQNKLVCYQEWFPYPDDEATEVVLKTNKQFEKYGFSNATFKITNSGRWVVLHHVDR